MELQTAQQDRVRCCCSVQKHYATWILLLQPPTPELTRAKKRRQREGDVASVRATPAGENLRAVYCKDPVLYVEAVGEKEILVVERAWADVWKGLAPPLYRHRYGS